MGKDESGTNSYKGEQNPNPSPSDNPPSVSGEALSHSDGGEYTSTHRPSGGGHGQDAIDYMDSHGIPYEINIEYNNGVRRGNLPTSKEKMKRTGNRQSWFPKSWTANDIKYAGIAVAKTFRGHPKAGDHHAGIVNGVSVTIIYGENGTINTIFPSETQPGGIKK